MDAGAWSPVPQDSAGFGAFITSFPLFWFDDNGLKLQAAHRPAGLSPLLAFAYPPLLPTCLGHPGSSFAPRWEGLPNPTGTPRIYGMFAKHPLMDTPSS